VTQTRLFQKVGFVSPVTSIQFDLPVAPLRDRVNRSTDRPA
jgi:hypothetical protein